MGTDELDDRTTGTAEYFYDFLEMEENCKNGYCDEPPATNRLKIRVGRYLTIKDFVYILYIINETLAVVFKTL